MNPKNLLTTGTFEVMPFQSKGRKYSKSPMGGEELNKAISALPFFGGTSTETETESPSSETSTSTTDSSKTKTNDNSGGGDSKIEITPEKFQELQSQLAETISKNTELSTQLNTYTSAEEEARKASMGREEALTEDLTKAQQTIDQMDQVIKSLAVVNAIQGNSEYRFHNPRDVIMRLDHSAYDLSVDLESGTAQVNGIEAELRRIAKEADYLLVKPNGEADNSPKPPRRPTGNPPGPTPTNATKSQRRAELEAKWPVIGAGRAKLG